VPDGPAAGRGEQCSWRTGGLTALLLVEVVVYLVYLAWHGFNMMPVSTQLQFVVLC
jgi:hypothetical protein